MALSGEAVLDNKSLVSELYEWAEAIVFSLAVVVLLFTFVFRIVGVDGSSMENTLQNGDRVIISNLNYTPKQGDIIVFPVNQEVLKMPLIKRVIAVGGQTVDIDYSKGTVKVDGKTLTEPYIKELTTVKWPNTISFPIKVPKGKVFAMGDNRNDSRDSRFPEIGFIDTRNILGKAILRIFPFGKFGLLN